MLINYVVPIAGIAGHFHHIHYLVYIGGIVYMIETFVQYGKGALTDSGYALTWITVIISVIISIIIKCNIWYGICFALCLESTLFSIITLPAFIKALISSETWSV